MKEPEGEKFREPACNIAIEIFDLKCSCAHRLRLQAFRGMSCLIWASTMNVRSSNKKILGGQTHDTSHVACDKYRVQKGITITKGPSHSDNGRKQEAVHDR